MLSVFAGVVIVCALVPAILFCANLASYLPPPARYAASPAPQISVLIPARNEESGIAAAVDSVLRSIDVELEVIVMDDNSDDGTASIVQQIAATDPRVRLARAPILARGWNGKQSACWALAHEARFERMCFLDADVRLEPAALALLEQQDAALVSGFPQEVTKTWLEALLLPLIHFVLLGFLPLASMRASTNPAFAAGCGQFLLVRKHAYFASGGHSAIRATMHDGLLLPREFRRHGYRTDLADLTHLARCRMYRNAAQVWHGLAKNATEGIADPRRIVPLTLLLLLGQVAPFALAAWLVCAGGSRLLWILTAIAVLSAMLPRVLAATRFRQDRLSALLHPLGICVLLAIQWVALTQKLLGRKVRWKDRAYAGN
jgi:hypothetical protein